MAISFWQSKKKRDFSVWDLMSLSENDSWKMFCDLRWGEGLNPVCPDCLERDDHYFVNTRKQWTCKNCSHRFSVTSSTALAYHKLSFKHLLYLIYQFATSSQGQSANEFHSQFGSVLKTVFHNYSKIREAIFEAVNTKQLEGVVQIDCGHFCGKPRRGRVRKKTDSFVANNILRNRKDSIVPDKNAHPEPWNIEKLKNRRIILSMAQCDTTDADSKGCNRVKTFIIKNANAKTINDLIKKHISPKAIIWTDSGKEFSSIGVELGNMHSTVNHSREYMTEIGVHNNMAENYFSRMRRAEFGTYNGMRHQYIAFYAAEMAWRQEARNMTQMERTRDLLSKLLTKESSKAFCNYNHGHRLGFEYIS